MTEPRWPPWPKQRDKLYAIENSIGYGGFFMSLEAMQGTIDRMVRTDWWKKRTPVRHVRAGYPGYGMSGSNRLDKANWEILFHAARACERTLMHEMTHPLVASRKGTTLADHEWDHGPNFVGALLAVYRRFRMAYEAEMLERKFDEQGVRYVTEDRIRWVIDHPHVV